jgi:hypothetical protein
MKTLSKEQAKAYEDFFEKWSPKMATAVRTFGLPHDQVEDTVQTLITSFMEGDYLSLYDPSKGAMSTFVYGFVNIRLRGFRRQNNTKSRKELPMEPSWQSEDGTEVAFTPVDAGAEKAFSETEGDIDMGIMCQRLHKSGDAKSEATAGLIERMVEMIRTEGKINRDILCTEFGLSKHGLAGRIKAMRKNPAVKDWAASCGIQD